MKTPTLPTVALIDSLWIGHHPMYFTQFTSSLLRAGARVIGLCPEPDAAYHELQCAMDEEEIPNWGNRVSFHPLPAGKRSCFGGRYEGDPLRTFMRWKDAADHLADAEAASGWTADLAYFPYLDSYLRFLPFAGIPQFLLNRPWSGLYMRNHHHGESPGPKKMLRLLAKGDALLRSRLCPTFGVLDERFIPQMERHAGKPVIPYPDVTQTTLPPKRSKLAEKVLDRAAGRKIVGIIGLERRKGLLTLLHTAELARDHREDLFFVCAGSIQMAQFTPEEQKLLVRTSKDSLDGRIDNLHFDLTAGRIPDEAQYNSLFSTFDIAWAAYEGFEGSSGTLSKAAAFEIPCVASAGECIGQRIETYQMGATIPAGNAHEALTAIRALARGAHMDGTTLSPLYQEYRDHHSRERLDLILTQWIRESLPTCSS